MSISLAHFGSIRRLQCRQRNVHMYQRRRVSTTSFLLGTGFDVGIGCHECSKRRIHCDRNEPSCNKCTSRGLSCSGLGIRHRFNKGVAARGKWAGKTIDRVYEEYAQYHLHVFNRDTDFITGMNGKSLQLTRTHQHHRHQVRPQIQTREARILMMTTITKCKMMILSSSHQTLRSMTSC